MPVEPPAAKTFLQMELNEVFKRGFKALGPKEPMSWEMAVGTYWLPRVGMVVLAIGIVWLASLAIQRLGEEWLPFFRVALGYGLCAGLLGLGKWLEGKAPNYARVLLGGGLGLTYFVTYAMHFIPYSRILPNPVPCLLLLSLIVVIYLVLAQVRRSRLMALGMLTLGHLTAAISTLNLPEPPRFGLAGLVALSVAAAFFLMRNRWYYVGAAGLAGSYLNYALWLANAQPSGRVVDFIGSMGVLTVYFLLYALAEFFAPEDLRRREVSTRFRACYATANTAAFLFIGINVMNGFAFTRDQLHLFYFALGLTLLAFGFAYLRWRAADPLHNAYLVKAATVITLGLAVYFDGAVLTLSLALEAVVLLMSARRSGLLVTRVLALPAAGLALAHGLWTIQGSALPYADPAYAHRLVPPSILRHLSLILSDPAHVRLLVPALLTMGAFLWLSQWYQRTDWKPRTPEGGWLPGPWRDWLWRIDWVREPASANLAKPLDGLLFPMLFALAAGLLGSAYACDLLEVIDRGPVLTVAGLLLAGLGIALGSKPFTVASLLLNASGAYWWCRVLDQPVSHFGHPMLAGGVAWPAAVILLPLLLLSELSRTVSRGEDRLWLTLPAQDPSGARFKILPYVYALGAALLFNYTLIEMGGSRYQPLACALAGLALSAYAWGSSALPGRRTEDAEGAPAMGLAALLIVAFSFFAILSCYWRNVGWPAIVIALAAFAATALFCETHYVGARPGLRFHQSRVAPYLLHGAVAWCAAWAIAVHWEPLTENWLSLGAAFAALYLVNHFHARAWGVWAAFLFLWTGFLTVFSPVETGWASWHLLCLAVPLGALAGDRYLALRAMFRRRIPGEVLVLLAWFLLGVYAHRAGGQDWRYFGGALITFAFFGYALATHSYTALAVTVLGAVLTTGALLSFSYERSIAVAALIAGYGGMILFGIVWERAYAYATARFSLPLDRETRRVLDVIFVAIPCLLLLILLERIPLLHDFYLTISWTVAAAALFGVAYLTRQPYYRYAGLLTFGLVLCRAFLIDTQRLEPIFRIAGVIFLGMVLLGVAYGYVRWRERLRHGSAPPAEQDSANSAAPQGDADQRSAPQ
jgi:hypothetical protein